MIFLSILKGFTTFGFVSLQSQVKTVETHKKTSKEYLKMVQKDKITIGIGIMGFLLLFQQDGVLTEGGYAPNLKLMNIKVKSKKNIFWFETAVL